MSQRPFTLEADHVSWTVADADAVARFYIDVLGATELFRMGPLDAADLPMEADGRDWMAAHGCTAMQTILIQDGPLAGKKNLYLLDPWGHQLEIVD